MHNFEFSHWHSQNQNSDQWFKLDIGYHPSIHWLTNFLIKLTDKWLTDTYEKSEKMSPFCCVYGGFSSLLRSESDRRIVTATVRNRITSLFSFEPRPVRNAVTMGSKPFWIRIQKIFECGFTRISNMIMNNNIFSLNPCFSSRLKVQLDEK